MASLDMGKAYAFDRDTINEVVTRKLPGNYALGYKDSDGKFRVEYVGRSDSDVAERLRGHLSENYKYFKFSYATSPKAAFEKEYKNYHDFGENEKLDNIYHPDRPNGTHWKCPVCDWFD